MKIKVIKNKNILDFQTWAIWECDPSKFDWKYSQEEHCFIIEGNVEITTDGDTVEIEKGDYVIFPKNLQCVWEISKAIRKHYTFK